jgi:hypothetical protein
MDPSGNLYEALAAGGALGYGQILKLTPSNGNWVYTDVYDFTDGNDGFGPYGGVVLDLSGDIYGTAGGGGTGGGGTVWEITP